MLQRNRFSSLILSAMCLLCLNNSSTLAQATSFTYQGRLQEGGTAANGSYDFQFTLWDAASGGTQQPQPSPITVTRSDVQVTSGSFTVLLDFGASAFPGADRYLEISVKTTGSASLAVLSPRQQVTATPYAIRSLNATSADSLSVACNVCVQDSNINSVSGSKVSGAIPVNSVPGGSLNYIQNTTSQQPSSNFNISGNGTAAGTLSANTVSAATQYNISGNRVLSAPGSTNTFAGVGTGLLNQGAGNSFFGFSSGQSNTAGNSNAFFGGFAGQVNTTGGENSFFGYSAGEANTTANNNSFFGGFAGGSTTTGDNNSFFGGGTGASNTEGQSNAFFGGFAGQNNITGGNNSFFGAFAGQKNTTGDQNSFFGSAAGPSNTTGFSNAFFGVLAGSANTTGFANAFFGVGAGKSITTGIENTFVGAGANGTAAINNATAIGNKASVTQSNSLVLGSISGVNNSVADTSVGIGTTAPNAKLQVTAGDVYVQTQGRGIILRATDGTSCYRVTVNNSGTLSTTLVPCP